MNLSHALSFRLYPLQDLLCQWNIKTTWERALQIHSPCSDAAKCTCPSKFIEGKNIVDAEVAYVDAEVP